MKKLFLIVLSVISINCFSQDTTKLEMIPDSTKLTFGKVYNDVKTGLSGLAEGLKVGAGHVYGVLIKQQIVNAITYLIAGILGFVLLMNWIKANKSSEKWDGRDFPTGLGIVRLAQLIIVAGCLIVFFFSIGDIVTGFVNPEYGAIKEIITFVK